MSSTLKIEREDGGPDTYQCDNCESVWTFEQLHNISDISERVDAGGTMPAGECPDDDCGALCYPVSPATGDELWVRDDVQFPRLIAEVWAVLTPQQMQELATNMDLEDERVTELFERADAVWQHLKEGNIK